MGRTYVPRLDRRGTAGLVLALIPVLLLCLPLPGSAAAGRKEETPQEPISYDAASGDLDYKNKVGDFKNIVVTQGQTRIQADRAHAVGLDEQGFEDGRWTFQGNVRIDADPRGQLRSDEAVVEFRDKRISTATATGKPAEFQQRRLPGGELTRGHANLIVYDVIAGTIKLTKDAWLTDGRNQWAAPTVIYNIRQQRVQADGGHGSKPVHVTIVPGSNPGASSSSSRKPK